MLRRAYFSDSRFRLLDWRSLGMRACDLAMLMRRPPFWLLQARGPEPAHSPHARVTSSGWMSSRQILHLAQFALAREGEQKGRPAEKPDGSAPRAFKEDRYEWSARDIQTQKSPAVRGFQGALEILWDILNPILAEREGFEPSMRLYTPYSLSRGAPSATRSSLREPRIMPQLPSPLR